MSSFCEDHLKWAEQPHKQEKRLQPVVNIQSPIMKHSTDTISRVILPRLIRTSRLQNRAWWWDRPPLASDASVSNFKAFRWLRRYRLALHVVRVESPRLPSPGISGLTSPRIPACILLLRTCSLPKITHVPKYLSLMFIVPWFPYTNTPSSCRSAHQQPQAGVTAWTTHSSPGGPVMSRSSPFGPSWQREITLKPCMDFHPFLLLRIPLPWRWLTHVH